MFVVEVIVIAALLVVVGVVAVGRGGVMSEATADRQPLSLPEGRLSSTDIVDVRFSLAFRGYRMSEVDAVLARLAAERADHIERADQAAHVAEGEWS
jgi:DivIVA domain-containing protein